MRYRGQDFSLTELADMLSHTERWTLLRNGHYSTIDGQLCAVDDLQEGVKDLCRVMAGKINRPTEPMPAQSRKGQELCLLDSVEDGKECSSALPVGLNDRLERVERDVPANLQMEGDPTSPCSVIPDRGAQPRRAQSTSHLEFMHL